MLRFFLRHPNNKWIAWMDSHWPLNHIHVNFFSMSAHNFGEKVKKKGHFSCFCMLFGPPTLCFWSSLGRLDFWVSWRWSFEELKVQLSSRYPTIFSYTFSLAWGYIAMTKKGFTKAHCLLRNFTALLPRGQIFEFYHSM